MSMSDRRTRRVVAIVCLLATTAVGPLAVGLVVCVGPDGHAAIEPVHEGSQCKGADTGTDVSETKLSASDPSSVPCVDIPFGETAAASRR